MIKCIYRTVASSSPKRYNRVVLHPERTLKNLTFAEVSKDSGMFYNRGQWGINFQIYERNEEIFVQSNIAEIYHMFTDFYLRNYIIAHYDYAHFC